MPVTQISGISARNGHLGKPPTEGISPQSQIVPSTLSCSKTWTSPCCCGATSVPEVSDGANVSVPASDDVFVGASPSRAGATGAVEVREVLPPVPEVLG